MVGRRADGSWREECRFQVPDDELETEIRFSEAYIIHHEIELC